MPEDANMKVPDGSDAKARHELFYNRFLELVKEHDIKQYVASFFIEGERPMLIFNPDLATATKMLKAAHTECRAAVLKSIGE